jgi:hypothetical protein
MNDDKDWKKTYGCKVLNSTDPFYPYPTFNDKDDEITCCLGLIALGITLGVILTVVIKVL